MEGSRKLLAALVFGLLSLAALVVIILLKQFTPEVFTAWMTGTAGVFGVYMGANVVSKFSPAAPQPTAEDPPQARAEPADPKERGGDGLLGISARNRARREKGGRKS
jgi:hypothetical protein